MGRDERVKKMKAMKTTAIFCVLALAGCGVETAGTAAVSAKLAAEQAKQGKQQMEAVKNQVNGALAEGAKRNEQAESAESDGSQ